MEPSTEADRWVGIAAKLLTARDFMGSRTFAIRARESDPNNPIFDQILAVIDTLVAAESLRFNGQPDWYAVLQLPRLVRDPELIATHYRRLAVLLNPDHNRLPFADYALKLAIDAWSVLSDPTKKWLYDSEFSLYLQRLESQSSQRVEPVQVEAVAQQGQVNTFQFFQPQRDVQHQVAPAVSQWQFQQQQQRQETVTPAGPAAPVWQQWQQQEPLSEQPPPETQQEERAVQVEGRENVAADNHGNRIVNNDISGNNNDGSDRNVVEVESFWTACPYCYYMYEYQKEYQDCTLRCQNQNCRRSYHAVQVPNPMAAMNGKNASFCCWGCFPIAYSMTLWMKKRQRMGNGFGSNWVPFSPMFACPTEDGINGSVNWYANAKWWRKSGFARTGQLVIVDPDDDFLEGSEPSDYSSDGDWRRTRTKHVRRRRRVYKGKKRGRKSKAEKEALRLQSLTGGGENANAGDGTQGVGTVSSGAGSRPEATVKNPGGVAARKPSRKGKKDMGKLDLNVEFSNEVEDHASQPSAKNGGEDGIEGIAFFEGLDEFLSTLPILNVVGDGKEKPS